MASSKFHFIPFLGIVAAFRVLPSDRKTNLKRNIPNVPTGFLAAQTDPPY